MNPTSLTSGRVLGKNVIWSLGGSLAPLIAAAVAVPIIISAIGTERFGLLTIVWALAGYFNFFDFGLGQAITHRISEGLHRQSETQLLKAVWTGLWLMLGMGLIVACAFAVSVPALVDVLLNVPEHYQSETEMAFYLVALSLPFVVSSAGLRGILEAHQAFRQINLVRVPMGIFVFLSPLPVLLFDNSLVPMVLMLILGRVLAWLAYVYFVLQEMPSLRRVLFVKIDQVRSLMTFGGWMTISNLVLPIMVYFDRFVISGLLGLTAVALYVTPHEIVTRLRIIPTALGSVMFPALVRSIKSDEGIDERLLQQSQVAMFLSVLPLSLFFIAFAFEGMAIWLDTRFANQTVQVVQWFAAGVFINAMGYIPLNAIRAAGRPDLPAKVYLAELPVFFGLLILLIHHFGINGAAFGYFLRWLIDTLIMLSFCRRVVPGIGSVCRWTLYAGMVGLFLMLLMTLMGSILMKLSTLLVIFVLLLVVFRETFVQWLSIFTKKT